MYIDSGGKLKSSLESPMETALIKRAIYNKDKDESESNSKMSMVKLAEAGTSIQDSL